MKLGYFNPRITVHIFGTSILGIIRLPLYKRVLLNPSSAKRRRAQPPFHAAVAVEALNFFLVISRGIICCE